MNRKTVCAVAALAMIAGIAPVQASLVYTTAGDVATQNFDALAATGTGNAWANDSTIPGWSLFRAPAPGTAIATYNAGTGSSNSGAFYSFGLDSERALGGVGSGGAYFGSPSTGSVAGWITVAVTNGTGATLNSFDVFYDGEQWRNGGNTSAQTMVLEYGFGATFDTVATWTAAGAGFDFTSPTVGSTGGALDGNDVANRVADIGGTVSGLSWADGDTLWVRWIENNDAGNDHGLSVDNWRFSGSVVPEPTTIALLSMGVVTLIRRRKA